MAPTGDRITLVQSPETEQRAKPLTAQLTTREDRLLTARLDAARIVTTAMAEHGVSDERIALKSPGCSKSRMQQLRVGGNLPLYRLIDFATIEPTLYAAIVTGLVERIDEQPRPVALSPLQHVARVAAESGDVARVTAEALSDGEVSSSERSSIVREARQAIAALEAMVRDLEAGR